MTSTVGRREIPLPEMRDRGEVGSGRETKTSVELTQRQVGRGSWS